MNALDELRENLRDAARRDIEAERARTRRRKRRATGLIAIALLGGAGAATASQLISVGEPAGEATRDFEGAECDKYRPTNPDGVRLVMTADAGAGRLPFGIGLYTASNGQRCLHAGQVNRNSLGVVVGGEWRPYRERKGVCGGRASWSDLRRLRGPDRGVRHRRAERPARGRPRPGGTEGSRAGRYVHVRLQEAAAHSAAGVLRMIVLGAGVCGLALALMLARDGHDVTVLERDPAPAPHDPEAAWERWDRDGVVQFRQAHLVQARARQVLEDELPDVLEALRGGRRAAARPARAACRPRSRIARRAGRRAARDAGRGAARRSSRCIARAAEDEVVVRRGVAVTGLETARRPRHGRAHGPRRRARTPTS